MNLRIASLLASEPSLQPCIDEPETHDTGRPITLGHVFGERLSDVAT